MYYPGTSEYNPDKQVIEQEEIDRVLSAVGMMSEVNRDVLILRYVHGLSAVEISKIMNISINTVKSRLKRGTLALRTELYQKENKSEAIENA